MNQRPRLRLNPRQPSPEPDPGRPPSGPPGWQPRRERPAAPDRSDRPERPERVPGPLLRTSRGRRLTPFRLAIAIALIGSTIFIVIGLINRTANQIPILSAGLAVFGLTMAAIAVACVVTVIRSARTGRDANAFWAALAGGVAVLAASATFAAAFILALVWSSARGG